MRAKCRKTKCLETARLRVMINRYVQSLSMSGIPYYMISKKQIEDRIVAKANKDLKKELKSKMNLSKIVGGLPSEFKLNPAMRQLQSLRGAEKLLQPPVSSQVLLTKKVDPVISYSTNKGRTTCRVRHREFVQDIGGVGTALYNVWFAPRINPGSGSLFPWLADVADRFEKYRFNALALEYRSLVGTSKAGKIMISTDFDVLDSIPQTKLAQSMSKCLVEGPVWSNFQLVINKGDLHNEPAERYVAASINGNQILSGTDPKTYDIGRLVVSTMGVDASPPICGELWVEYDVELITPTNPPASGNAIGGTSSAAIAFLTQNPNYSQTGNVYFQPILNSNNFRCGVSGEYKVIVAQNGTAMVSTQTFAIVTSFSSDTALTNDTNVQIGSATRSSGGANIRAREGDIFSITNPGGSPAAYTLYMFEFPYI